MSETAQPGTTSAPAARIATWSMRLEDERATRRLACEVGLLLRAGDLVTLSGGLGAGKTTFARALVRFLAADPDLEVPSPTFTLIQSYEGVSAPIVHADLYRLSGADELEALGFEELALNAISLVEWPERALEALSTDRLDVAIRFDASGADQMRIVTLSGHGGWAERLDRTRAIHRLLETSGWADAPRVHMQGDASSRAYERLVRDSGERAVLMISPPRPDGPPVRRGKPYSAIAKLAESVHAFVAMDRGLIAQGLSAPVIHAQDLDAGLLLIEDLGQGAFTDGRAPIPERYLEAVGVLAHLHTRALPWVLPVADTREHTIPFYDLDAFLIEAELLPDWYLPHLGGGSGLLSGAARADFINQWTQLLADIIAAPPTWVLRDYHSPNLIWLPERQGIARVGIIDFQDALIGHPAYDLASLGQDARVDVPADLELRLLGHYAGLRRRVEPDFDVAAFAQAYAILGAQRATKILGIFARLDKRDRKPQYLAHLPRVEAYLRRNLDHPALESLKAWYQQHLPRLFAA